MALSANHEANMDKSTTIKAADIVPEARQWVASVLQVHLTDDDQLTLALHRDVESEQAGRRDAARNRLMGILAKMDEKTRDVPDAEMEQAIEEAMQFVRSPAGE